MPSGDGPVSVAHDGHSVWVGFGISNTVVRVDPRGGLPIGGSISVGPPGWPSTARTWVAARNGATLPTFA